MKEINIVIGANYGDEGKGLVTNSVTKSNGVVVLSNGGAQRGHTVVYNSTRHVFHHFGSATLKGATSYASADFLLNPVEYNREVNELGFTPKLYINQNCRLTTIYDMLANAIRSELSGKTGSTGFGVWETIQRYKSNDSWFYIQDYVKDDLTWEGELVRIRDYYLAQDWLLNSESNLVSYFTNNAIMDQFIADLYTFFNTVEGIKTEEQIFNMFESITVECGQGLALDELADAVDGTPTKTGSTNLLPWLEFAKNGHAINRYYVTRSYITRHGAGELPNEDNNLCYTDLTNKPNDFQGAIRFAPMTTLHKTLMVDRIKADLQHTICRNIKINNYVVVTHFNEEQPDLKFLAELPLTNILYSSSETDIDNV